jgi:TolA-binding protein
MFAYNNSRTNDNRRPEASPNINRTLDHKSLKMKNYNNNISTTNSRYDETSDSSSSSSEESIELRKPKSNESSRSLEKEKDINKIRNEYEDLKGKYDSLLKQTNLLEASLKNTNILYDIYNEQRSLISRLEKLERNNGCSQSSEKSSCVCSQSSEKSSCGCKIKGNVTIQSETGQNVTIPTTTTSLTNANTTLPNTILPKNVKNT